MAIQFLFSNISTYKLFLKSDVTEYVRSKEIKDILHTNKNSNNHNELISYFLRVQK